MAENKIEQYTEEVKLNTQELDKNTEALENNTEAKSENAKESDNVIQANNKITEQTKKLDFQMEKVGSTANTALGVLAAGVSKTNPLLATSLQSVQRLIPNIVAIGSAAKQAGSLAKAAISSTGVGLIITGITTALSLIEQFIQKSNDAKEAAAEATAKWAELVLTQVQAADASVTKEIEALDASWVAYNRSRDRQYDNDLKKRDEYQRKVDQLAKTGQRSLHFEQELAKYKAKVAEDENRLNIKYADEYKKHLEKKAELASKYSTSTVKSTQETQSKIDALVKSSYSSEREKLKDQYESLKKAAKGNKKQLLQIEEWYAGEVSKIDEKEKAERLKLVDKIAESTATVQDKLNQLRSDAAAKIKFLGEELEREEISLEEYNSMVVGVQRNLKEAIDEIINKLVAATPKVDEFKETLKQTTEEAYELAIALSEELADSFELPSISPWAEWYSLQDSEFQKRMSQIEQQKQAFIDAGISSVKVTKWANKEKAKLFAEESEKYGDVVGKIGEAYESILRDRLDAELKAGKITEEEYEKQLKKVKAFQYAQTIINGAAGAIKIWAGEGETAYKLAMTAGLAAEVATALLSIKNSSMSSIDSGSSSGKATISYSSPSPQQTYVVNNQDNSDLVSAINGVQTVLVVDDLNRVQGRQRRVKTQSGF